MNVDREIPEIITADERKLKQILYNLLANAVKFTPDGGTIVLSVLRSRRLEMGRDVFRISIADSGIGIKASDLDRIFNPFEQADGSASRRYQGTGLGLSLSRRFVELHGGRLWAESEGEGKGSTFHVEIPELSKISV
jgi:signal transduction histidine kinase